MLKILLISIFFFCIGHTCYSQDYSLYYKYIDSIHYYQQQNNFNKALALYKTCFSQFKGFHDDYCEAISYTDYTKNKKI